MNLGIVPWLGLAQAVYLLFIAFLAAVAGTTLAWMLYAWRTPDALLGTRFPTRREPQHRFSLLVPAWREEAVLGETLDRLAGQTHPAVEIFAVVRADDPATREVAEAAAGRHRRVRVITHDYSPRSKPSALNTALPHCRGDIVGVFDAEDEVSPELLCQVDSLFVTSGSDVVQAGVQLMNFWSSWFSVRNVLEYYFWFRSRLHFHADAGFIPLGGNTVFIRTEILRRYEGWDDLALAEDCDVGVRLSTAGHAVAVAYDPDLVTREETPATLRALVRQRTRWNQGFLQVLRKGDWKRLPTVRQRALAVYTLAMPFVQAYVGVLIPVSVATVFLVKMPLAVALTSWLPLIPTLLTVAIEVAGLCEFGHTFGLRVRVRDYVRVVVGTPAYHLTLAFAAARATWRHLRGVGNWEKSQHLNLHRLPMTGRP